MKNWKVLPLFLAGGTGYVGLELLWRGRSHASMFLAGGICFLLLGQVNRLRRPAMPVRCLMGSAAITAVELVTGLVFNRNYSVWDYRSLPMNLMGQVCLPFSLLWVPVSFGGMLLYGLLERQLEKLPKS